MMRVLIACGGSGGHIFPAIALSQGLKQGEGDIDLSFIGSNSALDKRIFDREGLRYSMLSSNKMPYRFSAGTIVFFIKLFFDIARAVFITARYSPDAVVGFGGYVSGPVIFAAYLLGIPSIVHEQNVVPGRANSFLFRFAGRIAISFEETRKYLGSFNSKAVFTGNPVRTTLLRSDRTANAIRFGLGADKFTILVIGGSQGAHNLNKAFLEGVSGLGDQRLKGLQVIHITGVKDYEWVRSDYLDLGIEHRVFSFIDNIEEAYSVSDLVMTRSGASAIFEIAYFGIPMILVPYPFAMSHQAENARVFSKRGAAIQIDEKEMSAEMVKNSIEDLLNRREALGEMAKKAKSLSVPDSSHRLASEVLKKIRERR